MDYLNHIFAVLGFSALCVVWLIVQYLAKSMHTKNLFENQGGCSGSCANSTSGESCESKGNTCERSLK
ncbi:MAG: hypothetical protein H8E38_07640 [SAR324 cluster bacterium]|nr:hypothetical protein [SAR324 cluster bacterium]MBL7034533.1 hypothetical protein [SAR324 cluster bacterium]